MSEVVVSAGEQRNRALFVLQHHHEQFDLMPFSIARTWIDDKGVDLALYLMYDAVQLVRKEVIEQHPDIQAAVDYLLSRGVPIYTCGFCSRACQTQLRQLLSRCCCRQSPYLLFLGDGTQSCLLLDIPLLHLIRRVYREDITPLSSQHKMEIVSSAGRLSPLPYPIMRRLSQWLLFRKYRFRRQASYEFPITCMKVTFLTSMARSILGAPCCPAPTD